MSTSASRPSTPAGAVTTSDAAVSPSIAAVARGDVAAGVGEGECDAAELAALGVLEGAVRRVAVVDEHGVGERAERGGDRRLVAGLDLQRLGEQSAHAGDAGGDERRRAVLLVERERERLRCVRRARPARARARAAPRGCARSRPRPRTRPPARARTPRRGRSRRPRRPSASASTRRAAAAARGAAVGGRLERVRVAQHLAAHGGELRRGRVGLAGELRELEVVGRDERALAGDALVDGVELGARGADRRLVRVVEGGCRVADGRRGCRRARPRRLVDHRAGDARRGIRLLGPALPSRAMRCRASESRERRLLLRLLEREASWSAPRSTSSPR